MQLVNLSAVLGLLACLASAAVAQRLVIEPSHEPVLGTPLSIAVADVPPGATVTLRAQRAVREWDGRRALYAAEARYVADAQGRVDLAAARPLSGSYTEPDVQGLFWSAAPQPGADTAGLADNQVRLTLRRADRDVATATLTLHRSHPAMSSTPVPDLPGAVLARLPGDAPRPGLIVLGGSEGGSAAVRWAAGLWAAQGYAVLALPYYSPGGWGPNGPTPPELPQLPAAFADIAIDRLATAHAWLQAQPGVAADRIGVLGVSKGAEFALNAAVRYPWLRSMVAIVPSDVNWEGWGPGTVPGRSASFAWQGQPLPFVPYVGLQQEMAGFATGGPVHIRRPHDAGRSAHPESVAAARIPVERYAGPLMVIAGGDDQVWDSGAMAQAIVSSRAAAGRETVALIYPEAGHLLSGPGWAPTTTLNAGPMQLGGRPAANGRAVADAWPRTVDFLRRTLGPVPAVPPMPASPASPGTAPAR